MSIFARLAGVSLATAALLTLAAPARATPIERIVSPGGIEAWLVHDKTVPLLAMEFAFVGGSSQDPEDKPGVASMAASLFDKGAGDLDYRAFQDRLERKAIEFGIRASRDYLRGTLRTLTENRDEAFELLRLALTSPRFDTEPVERARAQILSGLQRETTSPESIASRRWWEAAFPDHPYGRPTNGTLQSVPSITPDDLRAYTRRVIARGTLRIGIVGDIDAESAKQMLDRVFGGLPVKANLRPVSPTTPRGLGSRILVQLDVPQAVVTFGGQGIARNDPDFIPAYVVNHILGGGSFSSRLYHEIREKRGLAYSVYGTLAWFNYAALMVGGTATRADRAGQTIELIEAEIRRMADHGPTEQELAAAKSYLASSFALGLDTSTKIASQLVQMQIDNLGIDYIDRRASLIEAVTLADAKRVANRLLASGLLMTVVGRTQGLTPTGAATPAGQVAPPAGRGG